MIKILERSQTVVTVKSSPEQTYLLEWARQAGKKLVTHFYENDKFPYHYCLSGALVAWTDEDDRALDYITFAEFAELVNQDD